MADLGIAFPAVVDEIDNRTEIAYTAWPERIYVVGRDGSIALKSAPGPFGFDPDELAQELERLFPDVPDLPEEEDGAGDDTDGESPVVPPLLK